MGITMINLLIEEKSNHIISHAIILPQQRMDRNKRIFYSIQRFRLFDVCV
jgi:hypothetical protein